MQSRCSGIHWEGVLRLGCLLVLLRKSQLGCVLKQESLVIYTSDQATSNGNSCHSPSPRLRGQAPSLGGATLQMLPKILASVSRFSGDGITRPPFLSLRQRPWGKPMPGFFRLGRRANQGDGFHGSMLTSIRIVSFGVWGKMENNPSPVGFPFRE